jgi:RNA polymerase sigma-70 factor (ECF subfamily)
MMEAVMTEHDVLIRLMREHQADVWRWLRYLGADAATADDITQETFIELYRNPITENSRAQTSAWLRKAARHRYLNSLRGRKLHPLPHVVSAEAPWLALTPESSDSRIEALERCLEKLSERARRAIELKYRNSRKESEVAEQMETTLDAAKALLKRTREQLRECIERQVQP